MKSRNGISKEFRFRVFENGVYTNYEFSFKHQALQEFIEEKFVTAIIIDGRDKQKFLYLHYFWTIDWNELIVGEDSDKLVEVTNAERRGAKIYLTPHIDIPGRFKEVFRFKSDHGKIKTEFSQIVNNRNSAGNKGTIVEWKTVNPEYSWQTVDPSIQEGISAIPFEEFIN